jgi:hypothetical protein
MVNQMNEKFDEDILGRHVVAKKDFPISWHSGNMMKKVADVKQGQHGIVCGFDHGNPIVNIVAYHLPTSVGPFEDYWEFTDETK